MEKSLKGVPVEGFTKKSRQAAAEGIVLLKNEDNILHLLKKIKYQYLDVHSWITIEVVQVQVEL